MIYDPPGRFIHWKAISMLAIAPLLGGGASFFLKGHSIFWTPVIWLLALPVTAVFAWKYSCYVADTHTQPWGYISFFGAIGSSIGGLMIACSTLVY